MQLIKQCQLSLHKKRNLQLLIKAVADIVDRAEGKTWAFAAHIVNTLYTRSPSR